MDDFNARLEAAGSVKSRFFKLTSSVEADRRLPTTEAEAKLGPLGRGSFLVRHRFFLLFTVSCQFFPFLFACDLLIPIWE
jgi:hypothetical protein